MWHWLRAASVAPSHYIRKKEGLMRTLFAWAALSVSAAAWGQQPDPGCQVANAVLGAFFNTRGIISCDKPAQAGQQSPSTAQQPTPSAKQRMVPMNYELDTFSPATDTNDERIRKRRYGQQLAASPRQPSVTLKIGASGFLLIATITLEHRPGWPHASRSAHRLRRGTRMSTCITPWSYLLTGSLARSRPALLAVRRC